MSYKAISIKITTCGIYILGYMSNVHCTGDSVVVLHAFEIPPLPYSSGPCKFNFSNVLFVICRLWRHGGLMVGVLASRSSGLVQVLTGDIVILGKTLYN